MNYHTDWKAIAIHLEDDIIQALKRLNESAKKVLLVVDGKRLLGTVTDGDIRTLIIEKGKIEGIVKDAYNPDPKYVEDKQLDISQVAALLKAYKINVLPIVNAKKELLGYFEWTDFLEGQFPLVSETIDIDIPVVIMAGGKGTRLQPFTSVLPKPLIPVKDKTAVECIIDSFSRFGLKRFYMTLNHRGQIIEAYFNSVDKDYELNFVWEKEFLGTAGALKLLEKKIKSENFIVTNCDVMVHANIKEIFDFHQQNQAVLTSVTCIQHFKIPYGVVDIDTGGTVVQIREKPEQTFQINTGVYFLNKRALKYIPDGKPFDMPTLIERLIEDKQGVYVFPIREQDYIDLGQWEEYRKALSIIG